MSVCAIMQPTYLPWLGYLNMIDQVDVFVLLDDVQFEKRSWQQRNRIKTSSGLAWLTVPARVRGRSEQRIVDVEPAEDASFPRDHLRSIELNYRRTPHYAALRDDFDHALIEAAAHRRLADLNVAMIAWLVERMGISGRMVRSSELAVAGKRSERLISICRALGADTYLTTPGSQDYLEADRTQFEAAGIEIAIHGYEHPTYPQAFPPFQAYASAIDALFNLGPDDVGACLRSGRRPWTSLPTVADEPAHALAARPTHVIPG